MSHRSLQASRLRYILTIKQPSSGQDATGQPSVSFTGSSTVRCDIQPAQGNEGPFAGGQQSVVTHKILVRGGSTINTSSRLSIVTKDVARTFDVVSIVDPENLGHFDEILAKEVVL